jgi:pimeloyl-ACP methyl ester carboxylesterase
MKEEFIYNAGNPGIDICYNRMGRPDDPVLILIMGAGGQMVTWSDGFLEELLGHRLQIVRLDNRDSGRSTHLHDAPVPDFLAVLAGDYSTVTYTLSDMAADTIGLINALKINKVHLVGASMGGMIAQTIAIEYPDRVKSLTSIMASSGKAGAGQTDMAALAQVGSPPIDNREAYIAWRIKAFKILGSGGFPYDEIATAKIAGLSYDRDHDPVSPLRQAVASIKSGDRTALLSKLTIPSLVIHGKADRMIDVSGGIATAEAIPNSKLVLYDGMGHSFPKELWKPIAGLISELVMSTSD